MMQYFKTINNNMIFPPPRYLFLLPLSPLISNNVQEKTQSLKHTTYLEVLEHVWIPIEKFFLFQYNPVKIVCPLSNQKVKTSQ